ncbi:MAG: hypothetical protein ACFFDW_08315 [Candidatus Thorarchaeota archaeon]
MNEKQIDEKFSYEKSSNDLSSEKTAELTPQEKINDSSEKMKQKTIKILSEKDLQYKEAPPPNFSSFLTCVLHFKGQEYKKRKLLDIARKNE